MNFEVDKASTFGNVSDNNDGSKNISVGIVKESGVNTTAGSLSVSNYRDQHPGTGRPMQSYSAAEGNLNFHHAGNPSAAGSLSAQHFPNRGNQVSAAAGLGVGSNTHRVGVEAFASHTMPKAQQNFSTVGARVEAQMGRVSANAGIAHTPRFNQTEHSLGAGLNLHQTQTSSVSVNLGSSRVVTPNHRGNWNHGVMFGVNKKF